MSEETGAQAQTDEASTYDDQADVENQGAESGTTDQESSYQGSDDAEVDSGAPEEGLDDADEDEDEAGDDDLESWEDPDARGAAEPEGATVNIKEVDEADVEPNEDGELPAIAEERREEEREEQAQNRVTVIAVSFAGLLLAMFTGWVLLQMAPASPGGSAQLAEMGIGFALALLVPGLIYYGIQKARGKDLS